MRKLTKVNIKRMQKNDTEHLIFSGDNDSLTKQLTLQQIEETFPNSLLILSDVCYRVDSEGKVAIKSAVVKEFCETPRQAVTYMDRHMSDTSNSALIPYHTDITKFSHVKCFTNTKQVPLKRLQQEITDDFEDNRNYLFESLSTEPDRYCSIKEINYKALFNFLVYYDLPIEAAGIAVRKIKADMDKIPAPDVDSEVFTEKIVYHVCRLGFNTTDSFPKALQSMLDKDFERLVKRSNVIVFCDEEEKPALAEYCENKQYKYSFMSSDGYNDLLSAILKGKTNKVVLTDSAVQKLGVLQSEILCAMSVKCEIRIEIISK